MTGLPVLLARELSGGYGDITVVRDFSAEVRAGKIVAVTGRNGVGKSTLMKLVAGHLPLSAGVVEFEGTDVGTLAGHRRNRLGMGYAPQEGIVFDRLSVSDNLHLHDRKRNPERYENCFTEFPWIRARLAQRAGTLSGGEKKILSFCRAMAEDTRLVLLDEPTEGVQPENIALMAGALRKAAEQGRAILIVEQNLGFLERTADHVLLLENGRIVFEMQSGPDLRDEISKRLLI